MFILAQTILLHNSDSQHIHYYACTSPKYLFIFHRVLVIPPSSHHTLFSYFVFQHNSFLYHKFASQHKCMYPPKILSFFLGHSIYLPPANTHFFFFIFWFWHTHNLINTSFFFWQTYQYICLLDIQDGEHAKDALSSYIIFRKRAL